MYDYDALWLSRKGDSTSYKPNCFEQKQKVIDQDLEYDNTFACDRQAEIDEALLWEI